MISKSKKYKVGDEVGLIDFDCREVDGKLWLVQELGNERSDCRGLVQGFSKNKNILIVACDNRIIEPFKDLKWKDGLICITHRRDSFYRVFDVKARKAIGSSVFRHPSRGDFRIRQDLWLLDGHTLFFVAKRKFVKLDIRLQVEHVDNVRFYFYSETMMVIEIHPRNGCHGGKTFIVNPTTGRVIHRPEEWK